VTELVIDWKDPKQDKDLDEKREKARSFRHQHITYDCLHARVTPKGIICQQGLFKGFLWTKLSLASVLAGRSARVCHKCLDFEPS